MNDILPFERARKPAEREIRREAILAAAAELFDSEGPQGAGLNAIAARAGFTKSNVYRYFESREEVLLNLFLDELASFVPQFEARLATCPDSDVEALAQAVAEGFIARPRLCALSSMLAGVVEQNVSEAAIIALKRGMSSLNLRLANAIRSKLPRASMEDCFWAIAMIGTLVAGIWPVVAYTSPAARNVLAMPEFAHLKLVPERDLARAIGAFLASIV